MRASLKVLPDRSLSDFDSSARLGYPFCDLAVQSFMMLPYIVAEPRVDLLVYQDSPTEMHSMSEDHAGGVLEIYPCSSKQVLNILI
jgi:hypothetical protein